MRAGPSTVAASTLRGSSAETSTRAIVRELLSGPKRFGDLRAALGCPSAKTLTDRLRALEHPADPYAHAEVPPRVVYQLTDEGESLSDILYAMLRWGESTLLSTIDTAVRQALGRGALRYGSSRYDRSPCSRE
ncbi:winged helix-turn-helix transcriptional regulator [Nocardia sp. NPDC051787]|uniref:winged helix-turn-helix transcriptional regulator n=1 Tax=Nocardia sp. NPDC051787 TaxID=3155415 RepID=UPI00343317D3